MSWTWIVSVEIENNCSPIRRLRRIVLSCWIVPKTRIRGSAASSDVVSSVVSIRNTHNCDSPAGHSDSSAAASPSRRIGGENGNHVSNGTARIC